MILGRVVVYTNLDARPISQAGPQELRGYPQPYESYPQSPKICENDHTGQFGQMTN
jgi:hypothetical protein